MNENYVIITGYKTMEFPNKDTGEVIDMLKISYIAKNSGKDAVGYLPIQSTYVDGQKRDMLKMINEVPGLYSIDYGMVPGKNNKPTLEVVGFKYVKGLDFTSLFSK